MQLYLSPSLFPLTFHCAGCKKVIAQIEKHETEGYFRCVTFAHGTGMPDSVLVEKGTLAENLCALSSVALAHTAIMEKVMLVQELEESEEEEEEIDLSELEAAFASVTRH